MHFWERPMLKINISFGTYSICHCNCASFELNLVVGLQSRISSDLQINNTAPHDDKLPTGCVRMISIQYVCTSVPWVVYLSSVLLSEEFIDSFFSSEHLVRDSLDDCIDGRHPLLHASTINYGKTKRPQGQTDEGWKGRRRKKQKGEGMERDRKRKDISKYESALFSLTWKTMWT